jgi:hypothetical protein
VPVSTQRATAQQEPATAGKRIDANCSLSWPDNFKLLRHIIEHKARLGGHLTKEQTVAGQGQGHCQFAMSAKISITSSESSQSSMKPGKGTEDYLHCVLEPRGIKIITNSFNLNGVDSLVLPSDSELAQGLGAAHVTCDPEAFAEGAQLAYPQYSETQWTAEVYQAYFLRTNLPPTNYGVKRMAQHAYTWSGDKQNITLPPVTDVDRRESGLGLSVYPPSQIWYAPKNAKTDTHWPDHSYFIIPTSEHDQKIVGNLSTLPAFRSGLWRNNRIISTPPYLLTEEKSALKLEAEARQYLGLIGASLLQERLLLRHLTDKAQQNSEVSFDESLCIYLITNCGPTSTVYKMTVRECPKMKNQTSDIHDHAASAKKAVRFDVKRLYNFDLTTATGCKDLKKCINYIHWWGLTVHSPALMAEGLEVSKSDYCKSAGWNNSLGRKAFYYTSTGIGFRTLNSDSLEVETMLIPEDPLALGRVPSMPSSKQEVRRFHPHQGYFILLTSLSIPIRSGATLPTHSDRPAARRAVPIRSDEKPTRSSRYPNISAVESTVSNKIHVFFPLTFVLQAAITNFYSSRN